MRKLPRTIARCAIMGRCYYKPQPQDTMLPTTTNVWSSSSACSTVPSTSVATNNPSSTSLNSVAAQAKKRSADRRRSQLNDLSSEITSRESANSWLTTVESAYIDERDFGGDKRAMIRQEWKSYFDHRPEDANLDLKLTDSFMADLMEFKDRRNRIGFIMFKCQTARQTKLNASVDKKIKTSANLEGHLNTFIQPDNPSRPVNRILPDKRLRFERWPSLTVCLDLSFLKQLNPSQRRRAGAQLQNNIKHRVPCRLLYTGAPPTPSSTTDNDNNCWFENLRNTFIPNLVPGMIEKDLVSIHRECYTDMFATNNENRRRRRLVMLSPDARDSLMSVDHESEVYIIGAMVDKGHDFENKQQDKGHESTYSKAKRLGIQLKRLPLERYVPNLTPGGSLSLATNTVLRILLDAHAGGNGSMKAAVLGNHPHLKRHSIGTRQKRQSADNPMTPPLANKTNMKVAKLCDAVQLQVKIVHDLRMFLNNAQKSAKG